MKLLCINGNIVIEGDFNIDRLNTNGSKRKQFCNILETFGFVQNIWLLYPNSVLSENYKYLMSKYKISQLGWNLSLLHVIIISLQSVFR